MVCISTSCCTARCISCAAQPHPQPKCNAYPPLAQRSVIVSCPLSPSPYIIDIVCVTIIKKLALVPTKNAAWPNPESINYFSGPAAGPRSGGRRALWIVGAARAAGGSSLFHMPAALSSGLDGAKLLPPVIVAHGFSALELAGGATSVAPLPSWLS